MAKEKSDGKRLKKLKDQLKSHSQNPRMVKNLTSRILTIENSK